MHKKNKRGPMGNALDKAREGGKFGKKKKKKMDC